jgi:hypothetical protein
MSDDRQAIARFTCEGCGKQYRWKRELAGRRVKCGKCLSIMVAPKTSPIDDHDDELYDLVPDSPPPRKHQEFEYNNDLDVGGTGVAMAPPVIKPVVKPRRGAASTAPQASANRPVVMPVSSLQFAKPKRKVSVRATLLIVTALLVSLTLLSLLLWRLLWISHPA